MSLYMGPPLTYFFKIFFFIYQSQQNYEKENKINFNLFVLRINLMEPKELSFTPNCKMNIVGFKPTIG